MPAEPTTIPTPIVSWETVVRLSDPLREPTRQRFRTLKAWLAASDGIRVVRRERGRAQGSAVYYSAATALAAEAHQVGDDDRATELSRRGRAIEADFGDTVRAFLARHSIDALPEAAFYPDLVATTKEAVDYFWQSSPDVVFEGEVTRIDGGRAEVEGLGRDATIRVDLPAELVTRAERQPGQHVWMFRRVIGSAAVITLLPAVAVSASAPAVDTYLRTGAGAPITDSERAYFAGVDDADLPTAHVVRPAG